jgi:hypothetical protein
MGDGCGLSNGAFKFCTESFSYEDHLFLQKLFKEKYGIDCLIQKRGKKENVYVLYVLKSSTPALLKLVTPYMQKSCLYKFRHVNQQKFSSSLNNKAK